MPELDQSCLNLQNVLTHNSMSYISGADLAEKIISLRQFLDIDQGHPKDVLNVLNKNNWCDLSHLDCPSDTANLAILSIENEIAQNINKENLIVKFANAKARKVNFV